MKRLRAAMLRLAPQHIVALCFAALLALVVVIVPLLPLDPVAQDIANAMLPVLSPGHPLGTDEFGRDTLARILVGAHNEILVACGATAVALVIGAALGVLGAYFRGIVELLAMRVYVDVLLSFPPVIFALLIVSIYGVGTWQLIVSMGLVFSTNFARIAYGQALSVTKAEYVDAARSFGAGTTTTLLTIVIPNILGALVVQISIIVAGSILLESGLSYIGLGILPPEPSWGSMLASGQRYMSQAPQLVLIPALAIVVTILTVGVLGDAIRLLMDPQGKRYADA